MHGARALPSPPAPGPTPAPPGAYTVALAGDTILTRPLRGKNAAAFEPLRKLLTGADAAITNLETLFHDYEASNVP
ncbi:MAG: hypothetical protein ABI682_12580, partial [Acidobacteriota bacterium]